MKTDINPVARPKVYSQFYNTMPDAFMVPEIPEFRTGNAHPDLGHCGAVLKGIDVFIELLNSRFRPIDNNF